MFEFIAMQDDPIFKIRREMVTRLVEISKILGEEILFGVIIPTYKKLSIDNIWSVRKACVEILPKMAEIAGEEVRTTQIATLFQKFAVDSSKWVKMATFQYYGPFIITFDQ